MKIKAFSLIELMIVVAIIGVLSAIAIPSYRNYTLQSEVMELINNLANYKKDIEVDYIASNGVAPATKNFVTASGATQLVTVDWTNSTTKLSAKFGTDASIPTELQGKILELTPTYTNGTVTWVCAAAATNGVPSQYLPASCM